MSVKQIIIDSLEELRSDYRDFPYEYLSYEIEAQFKIVEKLRSKIQGHFYWTDNATIPPMVNQKASQVKLEWDLPDGKHDIVIFKEGITNPTSYEDLDAFIEIKIGWGIDKHEHINPAVLKDFKAVSKHKELGFFVYFMGNELKQLKKDDVDRYINRIRDLKSEYGIPDGQIIYMFLDEMVVV